MGAPAWDSLRMRGAARSAARMRKPPLRFPMKRMPSETTGEEWVSEPRGTFQRMPVLEGKSIFAGRPVSGETMLRDHAVPH